MITPRRSAATAVATALVLLTAACGSAGSTVSGRNVDPSRSGSATSAPATSSPGSASTDTPAADPASSSAQSPTDEPSEPSGPTAPARRTTAPAPRPTLCSTEVDAFSITGCLKSALSDFWSGELNNVISEPVYVTPAASTVPKDCRPGLSAAPAFTCRSNLSLYINQSLLDTIADHIPAGEREYAYASVQAHEIGHVLQYTLHQPQIESGDSSEANSRFLEQQADCLSGVWAAHAGGGFDKAVFRRIAVQLVTLVSSNPEIATHGTPAQRAAAIDRGLASGRPQSCKLATFS